MTGIRIMRPDALFSVPAFSQVAVIPPGATTILVGGQNAVDRSGELVGGDDVAAQTRQVFTNVAAALEAAGATTDDLVSLTILLVEGVDVEAGYAAAAEALRTKGDPPLVTVAFVSGLAVPGALVEVTATAAVMS